MTSKKTFQTFRSWILFVLVVGLLWQLAAWIANNPLILPSPLQVIAQMGQQIRNPEFFLSVLFTLTRALSSLAISFVLALVFAFAGAFYPPLARQVNRLVSILQTLPNVCYIILLLFWCSRDMAVILSGFFLLFPLIYRTLYEALLELIERWKAVWIVYPQPKTVLAGKICLPMLKPALMSALKNASSLSFKVCVTSEILCSLSTGVGRQIQLDRFHLNLAGVIAWSLWLVLLVFGFEKLWDLLIAKMFATSHQQHSRIDEK